MWKTRGKDSDVGVSSRYIPRPSNGGFWDLMQAVNDFMLESHRTSVGMIIFFS